MEGLNLYDYLNSQEGIEEIEEYDMCTSMEREYWRMEGSQKSCLCCISRENLEMVSNVDLDGDKIDIVQEEISRCLGLF